MYRIKKTKAIIQLFIIALVFFSITTGVQAYDYPIGIPDAWIDPDITAPERPADWSSEVAGYYYIDNTSSNCNDANIYGYPASPRCSIERIWSIPAGAYIEVHGGPYLANVGSRRYEWTFNGTENEPIWFIGTASDIPEIQGFIRIYGKYAFFENILFTPRSEDNYIAVSVGRYQDQDNTADHMLFRNIEVAGQGIQTAGFSSVFSVSGKSTTQEKSHDIIFYKLNIHDVGDDNATEENDYHGILVAQHSYNVWILSSEIFNLGGDSAQIGSNNYVSAQMPQHIYIGKNNFYSNYENAVDIKNAVNVVVSENDMHDFETHPGYSYSNPVTIHQQGGDLPENAWLIFNNIYNCGQGIRVQDFKDVYIVGNKFWNIHVTDTGNKSSCWYNVFGVAMRTSLTSGAIVDNTFYDNDVFITFPSNLSSDGVIVSGNIFAGKSDADTFNICAENVNTSEFVTFKYNQFDVFDSIRYKGQIFNSLQSFVNECSNCYEGDIGFKDVNANDLSLRSDSSVIDRNEEDIVYSLFQSTYGVNIKVDKDGISRPQGSAWDIGAYEYEGQTSNTPRADVNNDSSITTTDALLTLRNAIGLSMSGTNWYSSSTIGDVNCDGVLNVTDALLILRQSLGLDMSGTGWCG